MHSQGEMAENGGFEFMKLSIMKLLKVLRYTAFRSTGFNQVQLHQLSYKQPIIMSGSITKILTWKMLFGSAMK